MILEDISWNLMECACAQKEMSLYVHIYVQYSVCTQRNTTSKGIPGCLPVVSLFTSTPVASVQTGPPLLLRALCPVDLSRGPLIAILELAPLWRHWYRARSTSSLLTHRIRTDKHVQIILVSLSLWRIHTE